jgi:hypothetical protein
MRIEHHQLEELKIKMESVSRNHSSALSRSPLVESRRSTRSSVIRTRLPTEPLLAPIPQNGLGPILPFEDLGLISHDCPTGQSEAEVERLTERKQNNTSRSTASVLSQTPGAGPAPRGPSSQHGRSETARTLTSQSTNKSLITPGVAQERRTTAQVPVYSSPPPQASFQNLYGERRDDE